MVSRDGGLLSTDGLPIANQGRRGFSVRAREFCAFFRHSRCERRYIYKCGTVGAENSSSIAAWLYV